MPESRTDGTLITGMNSAAARRIHAAQVRRADDRQALKSQIRPEATVMLDWIKEERERTTSIEQLILAGTNEDLAAQLLARKMHLAFLDDFAMKTRTILRLPPQEVQE